MTIIEIAQQAAGYCKDPRVSPNDMLDFYIEHLKKQGATQAEINKFALKFNELVK